MYLRFFNKNVTYNCHPMDFFEQNMKFHLVLTSYDAYFCNHNSGKLVKNIKNSDKNNAYEITTWTNVIWHKEVE